MRSTRCCPNPAATGEITPIMFRFSFLTHRGIPRYRKRNESGFGPIRAHSRPLLASLFFYTPISPDRPAARGAGVRPIVSRVPVASA